MCLYCVPFSEDSVPEVESLSSVSLSVEGCFCVEVDVLELETVFWEEDAEDACTSTILVASVLPNSFVAVRV